MAISIDPNILFTNVEAFTGNTISLNVVEKKERFRIPGITGTLVAFNISGNSMYPTIKSGDMVICNPIENLSEIKENEVYAIATDQSVWVKRIQRIANKYGQWTHLKLISDNHIEYDPFLLEVGTIKKILQVKLKLTGL